MGGLFGYSSENSISSLNVPAETEGGEEDGETQRRSQKEGESVFRGAQVIL